MQATVKIKSNDKSPENWLLLTEILKNVGCKYSRLQIIREGFLVFLNTNEDVSRITANEVVINLCNNGFIVVVPQHIISKKTVIIWNVDKSIFQKEENELVLEINRCNQWLKVTKVSKFTNGFHIKIECNEVRMANLCIDNGVLMYSFSYPPRSISIQRHKTSESNIKKFCLRCYAFNDHLTANCTKPRDYTICSECSSTNHNWRNCSSSAKMCINCHGDHRTMSYQCPKVKLIQQQQSEMVKSASSYAPTPVNHRSAPVPVAHTPKTSFADVVKQSIQDYHLTKDDAFKGFMSIMYASHVCAGSAENFQSALDHLLQKNKLPSFSIGDCPPLSPIGISTTTSNPHSESNNTPFPGNSEIHAAVSPAASETYETPAADIDLAVSSLLTHVRNSVQTENSPSPNQISQSSHSPNTDPHRSTEVSLQQTPASSPQLDDQNQISQLSHPPNADLHRSIGATLQQTPTSSMQPEDQNSSNAANDTFHSVGEEPSPSHQQLVPPITHETTEN